MKINTLTTRILAGLIAGLALGASLPGLHLAAQAQIVAAADAIGGVWLDGLRMTIIPLVFSLLIVGVGQLAGTVRAGGFAGKVLLAFGVLLLISTTVAVIATLALLQVWPAPAAAAQALRTAAYGAAKAIPASPPFTEWLRSFVPANVVKAATDGNMAALVTFGLIFGIAATGLDAARREVLFRFFDSVQATMMRIVGWVLWLGPFGVFFLAFVVGAKTGFGAVGVLGHYIVVVSIMCLLAGVLGLLMALFGGRLPPGPLARALIPVTAMAISTQSSLASLPVMLEATEEVGVPERVRGLVLPMAVALFRITSPAGNIAVALYVAHVYGVALDPAHIAAGIVVAVLVSLAAVGVASSVTFFTTLVPISMAMGLPLDLLPLLIAVETFPDFSRTIGNVWGDVGVTSWAARWTKGEAKAEVAPATA
ncbi:MAG: dicarboxylate/amino acid:cation symporter [Phenylobacterium sp.]|jgi:proton glutamate symport protein|nr:dicarboxylate/amino acid:cation symporter [Phenylobacterium sp.]